MTCLKIAIYNFPTLTQELKNFNLRFFTYLLPTNEQTGETFVVPPYVVLWRIPTAWSTSVAVLAPS